MYWQLYYLKKNSVGKRLEYERNFVLAENNIINLGILACGVFNKDYGFQFFDPFNMMFTKEEKEKFGAKFIENITNKEKLLKFDL